MTKFENFCKKENVPATSEFILEQEGDIYRVELAEDDDTSQVKFLVLDTLSDDTEYNIGDYVWGYINLLKPAAVEFEGVKIESWDYRIAASLKIVAESAVADYNDYISKKPDLSFTKI